MSSKPIFQCTLQRIYNIANKNLMNPENFKLAEELINPSYVRLSQNSVNKREKIMKELLSQRQLPLQPLDDPTIQYFMNTFALMDSNNFDHKIGVGERQSRVFSSIVRQRHFNMGHGIGRSGDVMANQPKAAGSSLILQLTKYLVLSAFKQLNYEFVSDVLVLPLATGMSISLSLLMLAGLKPQKKYVIWSRIDQKTCLKAIETANLIPVVVELRQNNQNHSLQSDPDAIRSKIEEIGADKILAIVSTTSCFAPRVPDDIEQISQIAKQFQTFHVVNNAYGIWCTKIANKLKQSQRKGECTIVVQSTDKNFLVPVGGSIIFAKNQNLLKKISEKYPGRASGSPIIDLFITLLSMGKETVRKLKKQRKQNFNFLMEEGKKFAKKNDFTILETPQNTISVAMNIQNLLHLMTGNQLTELGSFLYSKRVMGHRIVIEKRNDKNQSIKTTLCGQSFQNYGSHSNQYKFLPYITFACAVGTQKEQIETFFIRLDGAIKELIKNVKKTEKTCISNGPSINSEIETEEKKVETFQMTQSKTEVKQTQSLLQQKS